MELTQQRLRSIFLYAPRKGVFYWIDPPSTHGDLVGEEAGSLAYANGKPYHSIQIGGRKIKRSRLAFLWMEGRCPSDQIDHINGDSTDDRWLNLREATATENAWNHKTRSKRSSLPMGVRTTSAGRFTARIGYCGKQIALGTFDTAEEAAHAYQNARVKFYGTYA